MSFKKVTKVDQSPKPKLVSDKKRLVIASWLMSIAAVIYAGIVIYFLKEGLHGCGSIGFDLFIRINKNLALLCMILPFLMCVIAGIYAIKLKNNNIRCLLLIIDVILIAIPATVVIVAATQTINYLIESHNIYSSYCW